jgi:GR25 family glycosyltransferase involved in LPS biosynthesis
MRHRKHHAEGMNTMANYKIQTRLINCDSHKDRLAHAMRAINEQKVPVKRKPCVYGKNFTKANLEDLAQEGTIHRDSPMNVIEMSIFLSHYGCWHQFLDTDADLLMILEDDATVQRRFNEHLDACLQAITEYHEPWNIFYLYHGDYLAYQTELIQQVTEHPDIELRQILKPGIPTTSAYVVTRQFAEYLVKTALPMTVPVDVFLSQNQNAMGKEAFTLNHTGHWDDKKGRRSPLVAVPGWSNEQSTRSDPFPPLQVILGGGVQKKKK